jgi:hypothetical protein
MAQLLVYKVEHHLQACATSDGGKDNGGRGAPGGIGRDVFGDTGADGASACETTGSCVNDNSGS